MRGSHTVNMALRMARLHKGWSQQQLADFAQVSISTVARAERSEPIRVDCIQRLSECLDQPPEKLELVRISLPKQETDNDDMNRREATKTIGKLVGTALLAKFQPFEQLSVPGQLPQISEQTLEHLVELTNTCWKLANGHDLEIAESVLSSYLPKVVPIAQQPSRYQRTAAGIASQGYLLSASLVGHRSDLSERERFCELALSFARVAENDDLQAAALRKLAITYDYKQRPGKALQMYQEAISSPEKVSPLLRACICEGLADTYAQYGKQKEALYFQGMARDSFPDDPRSDPTYFYSDGGPYTLSLWDGFIYLDLNQPKDAEKAFVKVDGLAPKIEVPERVRIEFLVYQSATYLMLNELEQSCIYLEAAVKAAVELGSEKRYGEAFDVYQQMRRSWSQEPQVKALADLFMR